MRRSAAVLLVVTALLAAGEARAQWGRGYNMQRELGSADDYYLPPDWRGNPLYDGRLTFVRIKYRGFAHFTNQGAGWAHDYPVAESHFTKIMKEITTARPFVEAPPVYGSAIIALDDPILFRYPIAYMSEPDGWNMNAAELSAFKKYVQRGGFFIFDDMQGYHLATLQAQWRRAFPGAQVLPIPPDHPVFDSFFKIDLSKVTSYYRGGPAQIYGFFEDNDPKKRLLAAINQDQDLGEYMEYSNTGFNVTPSNEAYKLVINYFIYALTH